MSPALAGGFYTTSATWEALGVPGGALDAKLRLTLVNTWTVVCQAPLCLGFPRQEYWSGLSLPSPGDLCNPGIELASTVSPALQTDHLPTEPSGNNCFKPLCQFLLFSKVNQPYLYISVQPVQLLSHVQVFATP